MEQSFKHGDKVICISGYTDDFVTSNYGGAGYKEGKEFIIDRMDRDVVWYENIGLGVFTKAIRLVNEYEIY